MSIGIDSISAMIDQTSSSAANSRANSLENTLGVDLSSASDDELMDVCKEFEAYFVEQVMKEVEKTIPDDEDEDDGGDAVDEDGILDHLFQPEVLP